MIEGPSARIARFRRNLAVTLLAALATALVSAGCTSGVRSPLEHEVTARVTPDKPQFKIDGWIDRAGVHHELKGIIRVAGDSVQLFKRPPMSRQGTPERPAELVATLPRSGVAEVEVRRFSPWKTGALILVPAVAFYGFLILAYGSQSS